MRVFIAVVASTTDYRKEQSVFIDHTSVHPTRDDATRAVMTAVIRAFPEHILEFPIDLGKLLDDGDDDDEEPITDDQWTRLKEFHKTGTIDEWIQDDVPEAIDDESEKLFEEFQRKETDRMKQQVKKLNSTISTWKKDKTEIPFTSLNIPDLPEGEYVYEPIVWKIEEAQLNVPAVGVEQVNKASADDDEESEGKKRAKIS